MDPRLRVQTRALGALLIWCVRVMFWITFGGCSYHSSGVRIVAVSSDDMVRQTTLAHFYASRLHGEVHQEPCG